LDAQGAALKELSLQSFFSTVGLLQSSHLNETETARFSCVWVNHNLALEDIAVFREKTRDVFLSQARVNSHNKQVCTGVLALSGGTLGTWGIFTRLTAVF
jgi:hypothetical protein